MTMMKNRPKGFTLIEVLLVITIIGIVAAVAMPGLSRARTTSFEAAAIGSLRAINSAQAAFAASCGAGFFAPSLIWLARSPGAGADGFIGPDLQGNGARVDRQGYRIRLRRGARADGSPASCNGLRAGRVVQTYFVGANPLTLRDGARYFGTNSSGVIYESTRRVRVTQEGAPPPPARVID